ncbi:unnamed protein product, partial [Polarella glacialis]
ASAPGRQVHGVAHRLGAAPALHCARRLEPLSGSIAAFASGSGECPHTDLRLASWKPGLLRASALGSHEARQARIPPQRCLETPLQRVSLRHPTLAYPDSRRRLQRKPAAQTGTHKPSYPLSM